MDKIINIKDLAFEKHNKPFKIMCPYCNDEAEVMAYKRIKENKLKIIYICPHCGKGSEENHFLYED